MLKLLTSHNHGGSYPIYGWLATDETSHPRLTAWLKTLQKAWPKDWKLGESARAVFSSGNPGWDTENWGIKSLVLTVVTEYTR